MAVERELRVAYTPDSDDVFNFYAWEHGHVTLDASGYRPVFHRAHIPELNGAAREERHDVVAVSAVVYPSLASRYWVLTVGNSVGRGFGPVLVSKGYRKTDDLRGKRVGVGGHPTTGSVLALLYCSEIDIVAMPYDSIADAVARDEIAAGVMIHEEIVTFRERGLTCVCDLGRVWCEETGLPLPVGLNLVRQALGLDFAGRVATTCQRSLLWALAHADEAYAYASRFGRGRAREHIEMFSTEDTLRLPADVRRAMRLLFERVAACGIGPRIDSFRIIEGISEVTLPRATRAGQ